MIRRLPQLYFAEAVPVKLLSRGDCMVAIKTQFDGEKILLPEELRGCPPQEVIVVYQASEADLEKSAFLKAQEESFAKAWDNDEDAIYDQV
jgi:hypothetical protein